jgi:hypothetical protein
MFYGLKTLYVIGPNKLRVDITPLILSLSAEYT